MRASRLKEVFLAVAAAPPAERDALLDRACADDPALRADVAELLARDGNALGFTARLASGLAVPPPPEPAHEPQPTLLPGQALGPYRITRLLGTGGASCVYEASRDGLDRPVAVKVLHAPVETPHARWRFEHEVRSLSRLNHPAIVRIVDFGVAASRAYLVMDLIGGDPTPFAEAARALPTHDTVALLLTVCEAVAHAHRRGVIHRDLKSANVLVTRDPSGSLSPAIVDFGIARTFGTTPGAPHATLHTHPGLIVGTLGTLSPEQASGLPDAVDTRTDVWGLGVLTFEALTGALPHGQPGPGPAAVAEWLARVQAHPAPPASSLRPIPRDLDAIVARCLARRRADRYPSADALADDLRRFLAGQPTVARPPSRLESAARLLRQHWQLAATACLVALLSAAALLASLRARSAENASLERAVHETRYLLEEVVSLAEDRPGTREFRQKLLDRVQPQLARDLANRPHDDDARRAMAMLLRRRGELLMETANFASAREAFHASLDLVQDLHDRTGTPDLRALAASMIRLGDAHDHLQDAPGRDRWHLRAHDLLEAAAIDHPDHADLLNDYCWSLERTAATDPRIAISAAKRVKRLALARDLLRRDPASIPALHNLIDALYIAQQYRIDDRDPLETATEASELAASLLRQKPQSRLFRRLAAACRSSRIFALIAHGRTQDALAESAPLWEQTLAEIAEDPADPYALESICFFAAQPRIEALASSGQLEAARAVGARALSILNPLASQQPQGPAPSYLGLLTRRLADLNAHP